MSDKPHFQLTASMRSLRHKALVAFREQLAALTASIMLSEDEKAASLAELDVLIEHSPAKIIQKPREKKEKAAPKPAAKK